MVIRQKSSLLASLIMVLSLTFVLSDTVVLQIASPDASAQLRGGGDDEDEDEDEEEDDNQDEDGITGVIGNQAGVVIDPSGSLSLMKTGAKSKALWKARQRQAVAKLNKDLAAPSKLRKVSLTRLEAAAAAELEANGKLSSDMRYLAGLISIDYVFAYPETGDIVIAGPAEGFAIDDTDALAVYDRDNRRSRFRTSLWRCERSVPTVMPPARSAFRLIRLKRD